MPNNDYKKGIKTESRNQYTSYVLSKLSIIFFSTLAVKQNEHNCKRDPIYIEYKHSFRCKYKGNETFCSFKIVVCQKGT